MKGDSFIGNQPSNQRWSLDGQKSILIESKNDIGSSTYFVDKNNKTTISFAKRSSIF
jgi:hypothetical protein